MQKYVRKDKNKVHRSVPVVPFDLIHQEIKKFWKMINTIGSDVISKTATIGDTRYVLELCLEKKILKKLICFVQYIRKVKHKTVFFIQTQPYLQVYSEKKP